MKRNKSAYAIYLLWVLMLVIQLLLRQYILFGITAGVTGLYLAGITYNILNRKKIEAWKCIDNLTMVQFIDKVIVPILVDDEQEYFDSDVKNCTERIKMMDEYTGIMDRMLIVYGFKSVEDSEIQKYLGESVQYSELLLVTNSYYHGEISFKRIIDRKTIEKYGLERFSI